MLVITPRAAQAPIEGLWEDFKNKGWKQLVGVVGAVGSVIPAVGPAIGAAAATALTIDQINHERLQAKRAATQAATPAPATPAPVALTSTNAPLVQLLPSGVFGLDPSATGAAGFTGQTALQNPFLTLAQQQGGLLPTGQQQAGTTSGQTQGSGQRSAEDTVLGMPRQTAYLVGGAFALLLLTSRPR